MTNTVTALLLGASCFVAGALLASTQSDSNAADLLGFSGMGLAAFVIVIGGICDVLAAYRGER